MAELKLSRGQIRTLLNARKRHRVLKYVLRGRTVDYFICSECGAPFGGRFQWYRDMDGHMHLIEEDCPGTTGYHVDVEGIPIDG